MAYAPSEPKYRFTYRSGGNALERRDTLVAGGPLQVSSVHYLVVVLPSRYVNFIRYGEFEVDLHVIEYIKLGALQLSSGMKSF